MTDTVKIKRKGNFTTVDNAFISNSELSWKAKGVMIYMLSKPDNWKYNVKGDIVKKATDGQRAVYSAINELVAARYISRTRDNNGFMTYHVFEDNCDNDIEDCIKKSADQQNADQQNADQQNADQQNVDQQNADQQNVDQQNADQQNVDVLVIPKDSNTEYSNTNGSNCDESQTAKELIKPKKFNIDEYLLSHLTDEISINGDVIEPIDKILIIDDFKKHRKTKKASITKTVIDGYIREAKKAGIPLFDAIRISIERNWQGFNASWDWKCNSNQFGGKAGNGGESLYEKNRRVAQQVIDEMRSNGGAQ